MKWVALVAMGVMGAAPANKAAPKVVTVKGVEASAAFTRLKSLDGRWQLDSRDEDSPQVTWRVMAGGTAVLQTIASADLVTTASVVYAFEGNELLAVHTGSGGFSRLKLTRVENESLWFEGASRTERVMRLTLTVHDGRLTEEWMLRDGSREQKQSFEWARSYLDTLK